MQIMSIEQSNLNDEEADENAAFYAIKILSLPPKLQIDSLILKFLKYENLSKDDIQFIRSTNDSEVDYNFIEFFNNKSNYEKFIQFFQNYTSTPLNYELISDKTILNSQLPGHLFIKGLLYTTTAQDLYNIFKPYGEIKACKIIFNDYGISKGFGFLNFSNKIEADNAIQNLNGLNIDGNNLFVNHHVSKKDRLKELEYKMDKFSNIYIKHLPLDITKDELDSLFSKFGKINSIFLSKDLRGDIEEEHEELNEDAPDEDDDDEEKSFGFINFKYHEDAINARNEMNDFEIRPSCKIQIDRAERKKERIQYESLANHFNINGNSNSTHRHTNSNSSSHTKSPNHSRTDSRTHPNNHSHSNSHSHSHSNSHSYKQPNIEFYEDFKNERFSSPIDRTFSFSSNSSTRSIRQSSITSPQILPSFAILNNNGNMDNHLYNHPHLKNSNQRLQYPQLYQPIIPFQYNQKNKSQELILQPEKQLQHAQQQQQQQQQFQQQYQQQVSPQFQQSDQNARSSSYGNRSVSNPTNNDAPPFVFTSDSNLISTSTGLPIAGPQFQDSNLYVIRLPKEFGDNELAKLFIKYGKITSSKVITYQPEEIEQLSKEEDNDKELPKVGESKCFGFVCFQNPIDASKALVCMNGYKIDSEHVIRVSFAQRKENKYNHGRLHHYNQNHLSGLYQYVTNFSNGNSNQGRNYSTPIMNDIPMNPIANIPMSSPPGQMIPPIMAMDSITPPSNYQTHLTTIQNMTRVPSVHSNNGMNIGMGMNMMIPNMINQQQSEIPFFPQHQQPEFPGEIFNDNGMPLPPLGGYYPGNNYYMNGPQFYDDVEDDNEDVVVVDDDDEAGIENGMNDLVIGISDDEDDEDAEDDDEEEIDVVKEEKEPVIVIDDDVKESTPIPESKHVYSHQVHTPHNNYSNVRSKSSTSSSTPNYSNNHGMYKNHSGNNNNSRMIYSRVNSTGSGRGINRRNYSGSSINSSNDGNVSNNNVGYYNYPAPNGGNYNYYDYSGYPNYPGYVGGNYRQQSQQQLPHQLLQQQPPISLQQQLQFQQQYNNNPYRSHNNSSEFCNGSHNHRRDRRE